MCIQIINCRNIVQADAITIKPGKINVKLGLNGTGKSTISRALKLYSDGGDLTSLRSFSFYANNQDNNFEPFIDSPFENVVLFDEDYVQNTLFTSSSLIAGGFDVMIRTPEMEATEKKIAQYFDELREALNTTKMTGTLEAFTSFSSTIQGKKDDSLKATCAVARGLLDGNKLEKARNDFPSFAVFLERPIANRCEWATWHNEGYKLIDGQEACPFCSAELKDDKQEMLYNLHKCIDDKYIGKISDVYKAFGDIALMLSQSVAQELEEARKQTVALDNAQQKELVQNAEKVNEINSRINTLRKTIEDPWQLMKIGRKEIEELSNSFISKENLDFLNDETLHVFDELLSAQDNIIKEMEALLDLIEEQNKKIRSIILRREEEINSFLQEMNYPYIVSVLHEPTSPITLKPRVNAQQVIEDPVNALSYGERNAIALVLFSYTALYAEDEPDLVIFDDPVSSFDESKRYGIMHTLFSDPATSCLEKTFFGKTVLILTHDYPFVVDLILDFSTGSVLSVVFLKNDGNGCISETKIETSRTFTKSKGLRSFLQLQREKIADSNLDECVRLSYLRRVIEFEGHHQEKKDGNPDFGQYVAWNILSQFMHGSEIPLWKHNHQPIEGYPNAEDGTPYGKGKAIIESSLGGNYTFDYDRLIEKARNKTEMQNLYARLVNPVEKLQVCRLYIGEERVAELGVMGRYLNESCHVSGDYLYQLDPDLYELIPNNVMNFFDNLMNSLDQTEEVSNTSQAS